MVLRPGPTAVTFGYDDVAKVANALLDDRTSGRKRCTVYGALLGQTVLLADAREQVTKPPSREQVLAQGGGGIAALVAGVVGVLNAAPANVLSVCRLGSIRYSRTVKRHHRYLCGHGCRSQNECDDDVQE